jgi:3-deoxy-D-manno-octulosonic-acid transferase
MYFYARCLYGKDKIESVKNRFGKPTVNRPKGKLIWIHAASIGESATALTYVNHVKKQFPELKILMTTTTVTSADMLSPKIAKIDGCLHQFVVADNPIWIRKFLDHWKPSAAFFLESEIWPNIVDSLSKRKIPVFLLNARLSPRSFERWLGFKSFLADTLRKFACVLAQSEIDFERYRIFSPKNTKRMDNLKYANDQLPYDEALLKNFQKACEGKRIFTAASTHEKEEEIILDACEKLKSKFDLAIVFIPRHLTRVKRICEILRKRNLKFSLRSENNFSSDSEVFCVDTFGEVGTFFRAADLCFVGGSLVPIGGHNIYEPVALGKPVLHGPFMDNALEVRDMLKEKQVAFEVKDSDEIYQICFKLLSDPAKLEKISKLATEAAKNEALKQIDEAVRDSLSTSLSLS